MDQPPPPEGASLPHRMSCSWPIPMARPRNGRPEQAAGPAARLTGRGAVLTMSAFFLVGLLATALFGWAALAGIAFLIGCLLAARYTVPADLLTVVVSPPPLFVALVV